MHQLKMAAFKNFLLEAAPGDARGKAEVDRRSTQRALLRAAEEDRRKHSLDLCLLDESGMADKGSKESAGFRIRAAGRKQTLHGQPVKDMLEVRGF